MDTEVTKLIETLKNISKLLEETYGESSNRNNRQPAGQVVNNTTGTNQASVQVQSTPVHQPVHQLPVVRNTEQSDRQDAEVVSGTFDNVPMLLPNAQPQQVQPEVILQSEPVSDKDRIRQLEQELTTLHRQQNVNFNFAPVTIGGTNGQSSN